MIVTAEHCFAQPDFFKILIIIGDKVLFLSKKLISWYFEHYRSFQLEDSSYGEVIVLDVDDLNHCYPLAAYSIGGKLSVTLRTHVVGITRYPGLIEVDGSDYEGWCGSSRNKFNYFRAKRRLAGCSEVSLSCKGKADDDTIEYSLKKAKRGEIFLNTQINMMMPHLSSKESSWWKHQRKHGWMTPS